jgi:hypothetical protein
MSTNGSGPAGGLISRKREEFRFFNVFLQNDLDFDRLTLSVE